MANGKRPQNHGKRTKVVAETPKDHDSETPKFCLRYLQSGFSVSSLDTAGQAAFAVALEKRATLTWREITTAPRHGLGTEFIDKGSIIPTIPTAWQDRERFLALRYHGLLPMCGVRVADVLHILWIEPQFNDLYDHGS